MLLFLLILIFRLKKPERPSGWAQWIVVAAVPLISMAMLTMLYHCIPLYAGEEPYELSALSLGLLAINIMIFTLYATLSARANKLAATQQMLQQAELQNKYYHEVLAASDNMQGFRHDVKNHLQVLGGFLEMNNTKKAKQYLDEIGIFLCENETAVSFGYPLLDAVLGGKIALAKSMGVDIRHTVLLDREINMDQMDLCSILGNTLDNALEECARMGGGNAGKFVFIELENSVDALRLTVGNSAGPAGGPPAGSKSSKQGQGHGIGLAIVRRAVEKYGGTMETGHDGAAYQVRINIPSKQPNGPHPPH
jgi:sensor histidine kinase regulating citrate/malate metabolism